LRDFSKDTSALALNTATLGHNLDGHGAGWPPERVIDACAERGYGGIVFWRREVDDPVALGNRVRAAGLRVDGLCRAPFLVGPDAPDPVMDAFRAAIDMAAALGAPVLTIVSGGVDPDSTVTETLRRLIDLVAEGLPHAVTRGVKLALEPLHPVYGGNRGCLMTVRDALDICDAIGGPGLGVAIDVYHVWWDTSLPGQLKRAGAERIFGYHLCDWLAETRDVLLDRGMMGDGVADLKSLRTAVEGAGYRGPCEAEIFSAADWWRRDPAEVLDTVRDRFRRLC